MASPERGPDRGLFDLWSRFYDAPLVQRLTYRPEQDAVLGWLRRARPARILDVGCGTGQLAARIARVRDEGRTSWRPEVVGCDFSRGMLRRAAARSRRVHWVQGDAGGLPFADSRFDAVVSTEAFHWFPDPPRALAEMRRVLVPGGRAHVALVNPPLELLSRATRWGSRVVGEPFLWPTRDRMRAMTEGAGLRVLAQQRILRLPAALALPTVLTVAERAPGRGSG
jgi:ubiquinone/menaquinone biosynthesis C-methylase UbiE